jgi:hypothetical protein
MVATDHTKEENEDKNTHNQYQQPTPNLNKPVVNATPLAIKKTKII